MSFAAELAQRKGQLVNVTPSGPLPLTPQRWCNATEPPDGQGLGDWLPETTPAPPLIEAPAALTVLSFNIRKERDLLKERMAALLTLVAQTDPDIIALQAGPFLDQIAALRHLG